jgi:hypothetical protein
MLRKPLRSPFIMAIRSVSSAIPAATHITKAPKTPQAVSTHGAVAAPAQAKDAAAASAVKAISAAMQEATESPGQTMKEASSGDRQAQKLLHSGTAASGARVGNTIDTKA